MKLSRRGPPKMDRRRQRASRLQLILNRNPAVKRKEKRECASSFLFSRCCCLNRGTSTFGQDKSHTSLGSEVVFPLTSKIITSKLSWFPAFLRVFLTCL